MVAQNSILLIDHDASTLEFLLEFLKSEGFELGQAGSVAGAVSEIKKRDWDVIFLDLRASGRDGLGAIREIRLLCPDSPVVVMSGYASVQNAVEAMKLGAFDYVIKPFENDDLLKVIGEAIKGSAVRKTKPRSELKAARGAVETNRFGSIGNRIVGKSVVMQEVFDVANKVANRHTTVLLTGESGTGKSLIARELHNMSDRRDFPFITINCAVLPETLLESELFGHEKGAFTGAVATKMGKFELADKGTVFLDEIGTLSFQTQAKLLRVLQDKAFERLGGKKTIVSDVRVIAATNEDLNEAIEAGRFRRDLYYRLYVVGIHVPSLRERSEDIPDLIRHFIAKFNHKFSLNVKGLTSNATKVLTQYPWPGNVRELENIIERAMVLGSGDIISTDELPSHMFSESLPVQQTFRNRYIAFQEEERCLSNVIVDVERTMLEEALRQTGGHREKTAKMLGISRRTLQYKLKKYEMLDVR
ncbi:MAG: sigma-54-dependent Fis family transcriptional regulator [Firmicutes bacterium]|nr:sigma-54-dependent Fis family transcriptional regulator [Bacillota bacterium]